MSERVFVTGANGRIGVHLVRELAESGHHVVGLARSKAKASVVRQAGATECLVGDMHDVECLERGVQDATMIFHLAGGLRGAGKETADIVNHESAENLVAAIKARRPPLHSLLFTSTCAVYGNRDDLWLDETVQTVPNTRYGKSKVAAEEVFQTEYQRFALPIKIARVAAVYGEGFPLLMADQIRSGTAKLPGEGTDSVPLIHVEDCVRALRLIANEGENGGVYNVCDRSDTTYGQFYEEVARLVGGTSPTFWSDIVPNQLQLFLARQYERVSSKAGKTPRVTPDMLKLFTNSTRMSSERLHQDLRFACRYPRFTDGLADVFGAPQSEHPRAL